MHFVTQSVLTTWTHSVRTHQSLFQGYIRHTVSLWAWLVKLKGGKACLHCAEIPVGCFGCAASGCAGVQDEVKTPSVEAVGPEYRPQKAQQDNEKLENLLLFSQFVRKLCKCRFPEMIWITANYCHCHFRVHFLLIIGTSQENESLQLQCNMYSCIHVGNNNPNSIHILFPTQTQRLVKSVSLLEPYWHWPLRITHSDISRCVR